MNLKFFRNFLFVVGCGFSTVTFFRPFEINITYSDIAFFLLFCFVLNLKNKSLNIFNNNLTLVIYIISTVLFFLGFFLPIPFVDPENFLGAFVQYFACVFFLPVLLSFFIKNDIDFINHALVLLVSFLAITGIVGFSLAIYDISYLIDSELSTITGRYSGFSGNPNIYAGILSITLPLALFVTNSVKDGLLFSLFVYSGYAAGLVASGSFGGMFASSLCFLTFIMLSGNFKRNIVIIAIFCIVASLILSLIGVPDVFNDRVIAAVQDRLDDSPSRLGSYDERLISNAEAFNFFMDSPIVGIGLNNYMENSALTYTVHNTYLLVAAEGGILSFLGLVVLAIVPIVNVLSKKTNDINVWPVVVSFVLSLIFTMQVFPHIYSRSWFVPYFLLILICNQGLRKRSLSFKSSY